MLILMHVGCVVSVYLATESAALTAATFCFLEALALLADAIVRARK